MEIQAYRSHAEQNPTRLSASAIAYREILITSPWDGTQKIKHFQQAQGSILPKSIKMQNNTQQFYNEDLS